MIQLVLGWLFVIIAICFIGVAVVAVPVRRHPAVRPAGARSPRRRPCSCPLLVAAFVLLKAVQYWYDRYELLFSNRGGTFTGASYTDINAVLPAKLILMLIAAICAVGFVVGAFTRSIKLPAIALGLLVLSSVLIGGAWPLVLQQVVVNPNGINREPEYIAAQHRRHPHGVSDPATTRSTTSTTRAARRRPAADRQRQGHRAERPAARPEHALRRRSPSSSSCGTSTASRTKLAMDRYTVNDGKVQDYVVAVRELNADGLNDTQKNWINEHMVFTHGDGLRRRAGQPDQRAAGRSGGGHGGCRSSPASTPPTRTTSIPESLRSRSRGSTTAS